AAGVGELDGLARLQIHGYRDTLRRGHARTRDLVEEEVHEVLRLPPHRSDARMDAETASGAEGRVPGDAQLDQGAALEAMRPARQLLSGLEVREQVDH